MHSPYEKPKKIACHNGIGEKEPLESVRKADLLVAITNLLHPFYLFNWTAKWCAQLEMRQQGTIYNVAAIKVKPTTDKQTLM